MMRMAMMVATIGVLVGVSACCKREQKAPPVAEQEPAAAVAPQQAAKPVGGEIDKALLAAYQPLPGAFDSEGNPSTEPKVALGRMLYYETRLSKNHDLSCNSCHALDAFGVDGLPVSPGHRKQNGTRNSPTVYNAAGHFVQFWDGREPDVEAQAKGPILNPVEMAMKSEQDVVAVLKTIPGYVEAFKAAFPTAKDPVTYDNLARAIGAFERKLVTPSRWDRFLDGDAAALNDAEKSGFKAFVTAGCPACHTGSLLGGHMFQKLGLVKPWPEGKDQGRFDVTKKDADRMMFKVPSLRNIDKTGPYFHDGSVADLKAAVVKMAHHQLGRTLDDAQAKSVVAFLKVLTGDIPKAYIAKPELPASGPNTPKPDPS